MIKLPMTESTIEIEQHMPKTICQLSDQLSYLIFLNIQSVHLGPILQVRQPMHFLHLVSYSILYLNLNI